MALKSMPIAKLQDLKAKVDAAILEKVSALRKELEAEMSKLEGYSGGARRGRPAGRGGPRGAVAPKYRNPENPAETWAAVASSRGGWSPRSRAARNWKTLRLGERPRVGCQEGSENPQILKPPHLRCVEKERSPGSGAFLTSNVRIIDRWLL
jgi:DNA-binding protein H-NS